VKLNDNLERSTAPAPPRWVRASHRSAVNAPLFRVSELRPVL